jgi:hypothetical protein
MTGNESNSQENGTRQEQANADLREEQANLPTDSIKQPTFTSISLSLTQPAGMVPSSAQSTPPQQGEQVAQPSWQWREFPATPISAPPLPTCIGVGGSHREYDSRRRGQAWSIHHRRL